MIDGIVVKERADAGSRSQPSRLPAGVVVARWGRLIIHPKRELCQPGVGWLVFGSPTMEFSIE
jgi:hypothetical protein